MSFLGGLFGSKEPDERFVDDQTAQEDYRDDSFVGHVIDQACTVYDTMFSALEYTIKGKANVIEQLDKMIDKLQKHCDKIVEKYKEILAKLTDVNAGASLDLSLDLAKDALGILNANPILRRYVGEANYWMLWDMLAVMSGQGMSVGADITSNVKNAIKGTIYALLSMTNGMMRFEFYISQVTQFWGWLYMKEIWLPLTDSICPQVTCQYYYKLPKSSAPRQGKGGTYTPNNPMPGPSNYAPMPFPIFDQEKYSWPYIKDHFSYDDPSTWDVLTPQSRAAMQKAYDYWTSNYTNAGSANDLLTGASRLLTGGEFTVGFGHRRDDYEGGAPLKIGKTFNQLDGKKKESFPIKMVEDKLGDAFKRVDDCGKAFVDAINADADLCAARDAAIVARFTEEGMEENPSDYTGQWWATGTVGGTGSSPEIVAGGACYSVIKDVPEFKEYLDAIRDLSTTYFSIYGAPYASSFNFMDFDVSPLPTYLATFYGKVAEESSLTKLKELLKVTPEYHAMMNPYEIYTNNPYADPDGFEEVPYLIYGNAVACWSSERGAFYTAASNVMAAEIDTDEELGCKIDGGREPLFAALGVYGDLIGLFPWQYEVVPLESFRKDYTKIKGSYHIYYKNTDPSSVIFADRVIQAGTLKYIATSKAAAHQTISRGTGPVAETYEVYIFPSETCSVFKVPPAGQMFGQDWPSFSSLFRVDAEYEGNQYMYDLGRNQIPRYPKYIDADKWSVMDLIHELWLLADALTPICGDGGERKHKLNELLNGFGLQVKGHTGPEFIGQLPASAGQGDTTGQGTHVEFEFTIMNEFADRLKRTIDTVYDVRDAVIAATQAW